MKGIYIIKLIFFLLKIVNIINFLMIFSLENSSDENNFSDDVTEPPEPLDETQSTFESSTRRPITRHYQTSKKIKFNRKTGVFQQEWLKIYPWLIYDAPKKLMFCSICKAHKMSNQFAKGG